MGFPQAYTSQKNKVGFVLDKREAEVILGFDHGVGHPLLLLYDAKTPRGQKVKEFNGLGNNPFNASVSLF